MASREVKCSTGAEVTTYIVSCGIQPFVVAALRSGHMTATIKIDSPDDCERIAEAFRAVAADLRAANG